MTAKKKNAKRAPRKKFFRWLNYEFRWLPHTAAWLSKGKSARKQKREVYSYRVTNVVTNDFLGWFDDVDVAKAYLVTLALSDVLTNVPPLEEHLRAIDAQVKAMKVDLDRLRRMLDLSNLSRIRTD